MSVYSKTTGNRIAKLRKEKGLTQSQFAKDFSNYILNETNYPLKEKGFASVTISSWENASKRPKLEVLSIMAQYFNVSADYLLDRTDNRYGTAELGEKSANDKFTNYKLEPEYLILPQELFSYDRQPIYVVFEDYVHENCWGILNASKEVIIFPDTFFYYRKEKVNCKFYSYIPEEERHYSPINKQRYSYNQMLNASAVWVKMLSPDAYIRGKYEGVYCHNIDKSCLQRADGLCLSYEGYGSVFYAYSVND